jgi:hypothetical protein
VPRILTGATVVLLVRDKSPVPEAFWRDCGIPAKLIVGLPATPSALLIDSPEPLTAIVLLAKAVRLVLTTKPVPRALKDATAPVKLMV